MSEKKNYVSEEDREAEEAYRKLKKEVEEVLKSPEEQANELRKALQRVKLSEQQPEPEKKSFAQKFARGARNLFNGKGNTR